MPRSVHYSNFELAQVELVAVLKAHRREKGASGSAGAHFATGLSSQFSGPGDEVVVEMGFQSVGDSDAVS